MQSFCIFRNLNRCGNRCRNKVDISKQYCDKHKECENYIFEVLNECFPNMGSALDSHDIYTLFVFIHINDTYYVDDFQQKILDNTIKAKKELFRIIIDYLFSKSKLSRTFHSSYSSNKACKKNIIDNIYTIFYNTFTISQHVHKHKICQIQRCYRRYFYNELTKYNDVPSENDTDPFTYDDIAEIPLNELFGFKDLYGRVYKFRTVEFNHFLKSNGSWNPYTRDKLPDFIKTRVNLMMIYHGLSEKNKETQWITSSHAYTEVSQLLEKVGFYNNVKWFDDLTFIKCQRIIRIYRDLCKEIPESRLYFPKSYEVTKDGYVFEFCREVIHMFENSDNHYLICCNFMKSLALNIDKFYNNLPSWLLEIESTLSIDVENHIIPDANSDGFMFYYIYNLLENIPEVN